MTDAPQPAEAHVNRMRALNIRMARCKSLDTLSQTLRDMAPEVEKLRADWPEGAAHVRAAAVRLKGELSGARR